MLVLGAATAAAQAPRPLPPLEQATSVVETAAGVTRSWNELLDRLARADVVFLGETHLDDTTHRAELAVVEGLLQRRKGKVVLSLEMFERDVQPALDDYLLGRIDEVAFRERARPWGNYETDYRPLVDAAKAAGAPVVAANFPGSVRRRLGMGGKEAFDSLPPDVRALLPETILPAGEAYWARVDRATRGHMGAVLDKPAAERLYETQNLWDNAMGDAVAKARTANPDRVVLHVAGGFHVSYRDGTVAQFRQRLPGADSVVVSIRPVPDLHAARPDRDRAQADWLVYARTLARSELEGTYAVEVPAELRYRLSVPSGPAPLPLLVWLPDRHTRGADAMQFWTNALGDQAAVAVVEQPFPELQDDLAAGGRFVFGDGFRADYGRAQHGLERIVEHVTRGQPVDAQRVLIAGLGDGGAAVLWTALYGQWLELDFLTVDPTDLTRLGFEGLPDQKPAARLVQLAARTAPKERLDRFAADFAKVGATAEVVPLAPDGSELAAHVRARLGLPPRAPSGGPLWLVLERDLPRARAWAEIHAQRLLRDGTPARIVTAVDLPADAPAAAVRRLGIGPDGAFPLATLADGARLPLAGGPFGGTTVVVLPAGTSDEDRAVWLRMEQDRVLRRRSMFANLAIARVDGEPSLATVLDGLQKRGKSRVLIVPAVFCADPATMQELRKQAGPAAAAMDLAWLPGLGGELVR